MARPAGSRRIEQRVVEQVAGKRTDDTPGNRADWTKERAADGTAGNGEDKRGHDALGIDFRAADFLSSSAQADDPVRAGARGLEHFPAKWTPVRRRKCDH